MDRHDKLMDLLKESSKEPEGVIVYAVDGRAFFLTKDDASGVSRISKCVE